MARLKAEQNTFFMNNLFKIDENRFPEGWRFNSDECMLTASEKQRLVFLDVDQSVTLWKEEISSTFFHWMKAPRHKFRTIDQTILSFENISAGRDFFFNILRNTKTIMFFWGANCSCISPVELLVKSWSDFFYPSDETSIISIPNSKEIVFSFEDKFFVADLI